MQSAASGLIEAFKNEFGGEVADWDRIAYDTYLYGAGGILCWGTLCGVPNGCVAVLNLLKLHVALGGEVLGYYCATEFPTPQLHTLYESIQYGPSSYAWTWEPVPDEEVLAHTTSHSPLCHVSISKWCYAAGVDLGVCPWEPGVGWPSSAKNDRCGKICADMAGYTAELINYYALNYAGHWETPDPESPPIWVVDDNGIETPYQIPPGTADCMDCHFKAGNPPGSPAQCGKMDCNECHTDFVPHEGKKILLEKLWTEAWNGSQWVAANTFSPGDDIRYCLRFSVFAPGALFVRTKPNESGVEGYKSSPGLWGYYLNKNENCSDTQTWYWEEKVDAAASGKARFRTMIQVGDTSSGPLIYESPRKMVYFLVE